VVRDAQRAIFDTYGRFFIDRARDARDAIQAKFDEDLRALTRERTENRQRMGPKVADVNAITDFDSLLASEAARTERERALVVELKRAVTDAERQTMLAYTGRFHLIVNGLFSLFDNFVQIEDIAGGTAGKRKTMLALLKEKERWAKNPAAEPGRPFHRREWPSLRLVMDPLFRKAPDSAVEPEVAPKSRSRRKSKIAEKVIVSDDPSFDTEATIPIVQSLETPMHRSVVIERNREYGRYQEELIKRLGEFEYYTNSLGGETAAFTEHWTSCILSIKPSQSLILRPASRK
jgi:hypothetical protein